MKKSGKIHITEGITRYPLCGTSTADYDFISIGAAATLEYYIGTNTWLIPHECICKHCLREYRKLTSKGGAKK